MSRLQSSRNETWFDHDRFAIASPRRWRTQPAPRAGDDILVPRPGDAEDDRNLRALGRGPTHAKSTINGHLIVCTLEDTLTVGERTLVDTGHAQTVLDTRKLYRHAMRDELTEAVERLAGRKAIAFLSDNHINPDTGIEAFTMRPQDS